MSALERKPEVPASTPDEDLGPGSDWRGLPRGFSKLTWRLGFPEATQWVTEVPVVSQEEPQVSCCNSKVHLVKAIVFPVVMYGCESWNIKKAEH